MPPKGCSYTATALHKCLLFANAASARKWDLFASNEALFWFQLALSIDHRNVEALIGSATLYQYILSQPLWHNNLRIINDAFAKGIKLLKRASELNPHDATVYTAKGAIYSAIGKAEIADEYFQKAISLNSEFAPAHYFVNFNTLFINPKDDIRPGIRKGIDLAEQQKNTREMAAAYYFSGFANALYGEYDAAIRDLKNALNLNPGYGSAHLALIAAASLSKHADAFRAVKSFKNKHPNFNENILNYMWLDRSRVHGYRQLLSPMLGILKTRVLRT
jgi:tetratricopeptide (TPR) repeat protein